MSVRKWYLSEALVSYRRLLAVVDDLTEEEVTACLDLETGSQRRRSVIQLLVKRAIAIRTAHLYRKYL